MKLLQFLHIKIQHIKKFEIIFSNFVLLKDIK
jgi:hypothetical protein